jgi:glycosyltransferase involved in cell wall biosynthesis
VLHVIYSVGPTNAQFNEHCLPVRRERDISVASFFRSTAECPPEIAVFEGNGTILGFFRTLRAALHAREYDVVHAHALPLAMALVLLLAPRRRWMSDTVFTVHTSYPNYRLRYRMMLVPVAAFFRTIVFCSNASLRSMPRSIRRIVRGKSVVVQNGVDLQRVDRVLAERGGVSGGRPFTFISVGRLNEAKDPLTLVRAFAVAELEGSRLVLVGEGPLRGRIDAEIRESGTSPTVDRTGLVERDEVYRRIADADVFVSTSRVEGLPVAVLEAMACRRPVILSDIPQHREIDRGSDLLSFVSPGDVDALANAMRRFAAMVPDERVDVGGKCRLLAERFDVRSMHEGYGAIYERIRTRRRRRALEEVPA